jgi:hypothetical protein
MQKGKSIVDTTYHKIRHKALSKLGGTQQKIKCHFELGSLNAHKRRVQQTQKQI